MVSSDTLRQSGRNAVDISNWLMPGLLSAISSLLTNEMGAQVSEDSTYQRPNTATLEQETMHGLRRTSSSAQREGKFPALSAFLTTVPPGFADPIPDPVYSLGYSHELNTGQIIHVYDEKAIDTRINNRVLVVLYHNRPWGVTCLSFCRHDAQAADPYIHWAVCGKGTAKAAQAAAAAARNATPNLSASPPAHTVAAASPHMLQPLEVVLQRGSTHFEPRADITLNVRDHWYVEREVNILTLGYVEIESMKALLNKYESLVHDRLEEARASLEHPKQVHPVAFGTNPNVTNAQDIRPAGSSSRVTKDIPNQRWIRSTRN